MCAHFALPMCWLEKDVCHRTHYSIQLFQEHIIVQLHPFLTGDANFPEDTIQQITGIRCPKYLNNTVKEKIEF